MTKDEHAVIARHCEIAAVQSQIIYWQTVLLSGAYKDLKLFHFGESKEFLEKEKRDRVLGDIQQLVNQLRALQDFHAKKSQPSAEGEST